MNSKMRANDVKNKKMCGEGARILKRNIMY